MIQQGPLKLLFSFLGPKDAFIPDAEIIKKKIKKKMGKRAPYLSGYFLLDRGNDLVSGMEDCLRAQGFSELGVRLSRRMVFT